MTTPVPVEAKHEIRKAARQARPAALILFTLFAFLIFAYLAVSLTFAPEGGVIVGDQAISDYLMRHPEGALTNAWLAITLVGSGWPLVIVVAVFAVFLIRDHHVQMAIALVFTASTGGWLNLLLKLLFQRARPAWEPALVLPTGYSFPSGHAMSAMVVYGFMIYALLATGPRTRPRALAAAALGMLIVLVAASRVVLGAHWLTDVVAGLAAGLVWLVICIVVAEWAGARSWYPHWLRSKRRAG